MKESKGEKFLHFLMSEQYVKGREGGLRKKDFAHMEWHFLRLVLALLPEGVLAVVSHNFVLKTGF